MGAPCNRVLGELVARKRSQGPRMGQSIDASPAWEISGPAMSASMLDAGTVPEARSLRTPVSKPGNPKPPMSDISWGPLSPLLLTSQQLSHGARLGALVPIISTARALHYRGPDSTLTPLWKADCLDLLSASARPEMCRSQNLLDP